MNHVHAFFFFFDTVDQIQVPTGQYDLTKKNVCFLKITKFHLRKTNVVLELRIIKLRAL